MYEVMHLFVHPISHYHATKYHLNLEHSAPPKGKRISLTVHGRSLEKGSK